MTNDDKELLRLAAKAGGYEIEWYASSNEAVVGAGGFYRNEGVRSIPWNSFSDDADAFRLAVVCGIKHKFNAGLGQAFAWNNLGHEVTVNIEDCKKCKFAATRYAITIAAAATSTALDKIGKEIS